MEIDESLDEGVGFTKCFDVGEESGTSGNVETRVSALKNERDGSAPISKEGG